MHTKRSSGEWSVRFVRFHGMRSREGLSPAEPTIESFLTDLAVHGHVAAATQNQAMNALVCLDTRVLNHAMEGSINAVRADKQINVPVVMTRAEVAAVISLLDGTAQLMAKLLYGSGLRIMEAVRIRVKDIDVQGSKHCISRTWLRGMARSTGPMRWLGSLRMPPKNGVGRMSSPPGISP
jgi:integrase